MDVLSMSIKQFFPPLKIFQFAVSRRFFFFNFDDKKATSRRGLELSQFFYLYRVQWQHQMDGKTCKISKVNLVLKEFLFFQPIRT